MLAHINYDPVRLGKIRSETSSAFTADKWSMEYLTQKCPLLNSVWLETLHVSSAIGSIRHITEDTVICGKTLRRENKILISSRQLHLNNGAFGDNALNFDAERFLRRPEFEHDPSFRPFGGGVMLCPRRILAKHTVMSFIAFALHRFDIELALPQPFPSCPERMLGFGVMTGNDDLLERVRARS